MVSTTVVVPCFNESLRLKVSEFVDWLAHEKATHLLFVDDGSTDGTAAMLQRIASQAPAHRVSVLVLERNEGKAEAVRRGMLQAIESTIK